MPDTEVISDDAFRGGVTEREWELEKERKIESKPKCGKILTIDESRWRLYKCSICHSFKFSKVINFSNENLKTKQQQLLL